MNWYRDAITAVREPCIRRGHVITCEGRRPSLVGNVSERSRWCPNIFCHIASQRSEQNAPTGPGLLAPGRSGSLRIVTRILAFQDGFEYFLARRHRFRRRVSFHATLIWPDGRFLCCRQTISERFQKSQECLESAENLICGENLSWCIIHILGSRLHAEV